ncbi:single-stranded DNA-binding protein [Actinocorallia longicatena]|uniref:Single-stranded DNA-binding protein n=1 Tax=Actinocorallia longicatena TaxID=111803 RepID=A0ABP6QJP9_9ACTN
MDEAYTTLIGWVAAKPQYRITSNGVPFLSLRAGITPRRFVRETGLWTEQPPTFVAISCWKALAENVNASEFGPGTPIIAQGRLRVREYEHAGERRYTVELEAIALGPDLNRGKAYFQRVVKNAPTTVTDLEEAAELTEQVAGRAVPLRPAAPSPGETEPVEREEAEEAA